MFHTKALKVVYLTDTNSTLLKLNFKTGENTKTIFNYDCSCSASIKEFRVINDTENHYYECSCDVCMPSDTRPPISKYMIIESYKQIGENKPFQLSRNIFDENALRTKYPDWLREEYDK